MSIIQAPKPSPAAVQKKPAAAKSSSDDSSDSDSDDAGTKKKPASSVQVTTEFRTCFHYLFKNWQINE